jgi:hypothetical protein
MLMQDDIVQEGDNAILGGLDQYGEVYLGYYVQDKHGFVGMRSKFPRAVKAAQGGHASFFYASKGQVHAPGGYHRLVTNDNRCVTGWESVNKSDNYVRKDTAARLYPKINNDMFASAKVRTFLFKNYVIPGRLETSVLPLTQAYSWYDGTSASAYEFKYRVESNYNLFYVDCQKSAMKLLKPQLHNTTYLADVQELLSKSGRAANFYTSERFENNSPIPVTHTFKKTMTTNSEVTDTFTSSVKNIFELESGGRVNLSMFGMLASGHVKSSNSDVRENANSKSSVSKSSQEMTIQRKIKVPSQTWVQVEATVDKVDNVRVPYRALYKIVKGSNLSLTEMKGMLRGVGYTEDFHEENGDLLIEVNGELMIKAEHNMKVVVNGGVMP